MTENTRTTCNANSQSTGGDPRLQFEPYELYEFDLQLQRALIPCEILIHNRIYNLRESSQQNNLTIHEENNVKEQNEHIETIPITEFSITVQHENMYGT